MSNHESVLGLSIGKDIIVTTTPNIEGRTIIKYCGIISGEAILGVNFLKDLFAGISDVLGGRSAAYEQQLQEARSIALRQLEERAAEVGANAVVGVSVDYEVLGQMNGMLLVCANGTAVEIE